ncbi:unnamed protein product [Eruca vesicaria subsp. sativa]|uniref:FBD domain-containing protein n=1 Tax=Eruca vesicaria subsp. sativa TaxID=29727 RepID=A0ABC8M368_ERUVS|nr:unnamed protein product [Eruca vesicaria subsp. sativa]
MAHVSRWICNAVERGVLEMDLDLWTTCEVFLPCALVTSKTLVISRCVKHGLILPVFKNLVNLSFWGGNKRGWKLLPYLIKQSPKLNTLIIQGLDNYTGDVTMHLLKVKVFHVLGYGGTPNELEHLKSILGGVTECLELVQVEFAQGVTVDDHGTILQTHDPRWSCSIHVQDRLLRIARRSS